MIMIQGYYVEVVVVDMIVVKLGKHQLPIKRLRLETTSQASVFRTCLKQVPWLQPPQLYYDHLYVALTLNSSGKKSHR